MATSPETFSKIKNLLRKMDQSIDSARSKRLTTNTPVSSPPQQAPMPQPIPAAPPLHSIQPAATNGAPIRARALARPQFQQRPAI